MRTKKKNQITSCVQSDFYIILIQNFKKQKQKVFVAEITEQRLVIRYYVKVYKKKREKITKNSKDALKVEIICSFFFQ